MNESTTRSHYYTHEPKKKQPNDRKNRKDKKPVNLNQFKTSMHVYLSQYCMLVCFSFICSFIKHLICSYCFLF